MAFPFKYEKNVAFFHVKTWKSSKSWMLASTSVFDNYTFFFSNWAKKNWQVEDSRGDLVFGDNSSYPGVKILVGKIN